MIAVDQEALQSWVVEHQLDASEIDCVTAVMLKILDGKCKMGQGEKLLMASLYQLIAHRPGVSLGKETHELIDANRGPLTESQKLVVYEARVLAETMISRPIMKAFKARVRREGIYDALRREESGPVTT